MIGKVRKISMTVNLNVPGEYEGGNLKFDYGMHTEKDRRFHECEEIRPQGSIIVFPSFLDHCVTPILSGTRYSLVLWSLGAPWK
jgi:PKHD-type hydroxylase